MDFFAVALLICAAIFFGGILVGGMIVIIQARTGRRERLQMKQHLRRVELAGRD